MNSTKRVMGLGLLALVLSAITACGNILEAPLVKNDTEKNGRVRIYLGETNTGARTVQPTADAIAGYQLTFSGLSQTQSPVDITTGYYVDLTLADDTWTIIATAYKTGGTLGNAPDAIADGSITITLSGGEVLDNAATVIMLSPSASGTGTLHYDITLASGETGYLKLWNIDDTVVSAFEDDGTLTLSATATDNYSIAAGRYIVEAKLTNEDGRVAFRREVVEVWADTASDFVFAPDEFLHPNVGDNGVYLGIISFDRYAHELTTGGPVFLNASNVSSLKTLLDTDYNRAADSNSGTALYYAVHKALSNLKAMEQRLPENLERVAVVTFTDGLDQNSFGLSNADPLEEQEGLGMAAYEAYLAAEIANRTIGGENIKAYSLGVAGGDVGSNETQFMRAIQALASTGMATDGEPYYSRLNNFNDLGPRFEAIAKGLDIENEFVSFSLTIPSYEPGTQIRITFDVPNDDDHRENSWAGNSKKYLNGTIKGSGSTFEGITYAGHNVKGDSLGSAAGSGPIPGAFVATEVTFVFDDFKGYTPSDPDPVVQWYKTPDMTEWQVNSEYSSRKDMNTTVIQRSALIYLVLDCSTSLSSSNVTAIRTAAKQFIDLVYNPSSGGGQSNSGISEIYYSSSGGTWTQQSDGRYKSPAIGDSATTICTVTFRSAGSDKQLVIALDVSSESGADYAFVGELDNSYATSTYNYFDRISGTQSKVITIPVPTASYNHFVRIGYVKNGNSITSGLDSAWFKILN